MLKDGTGLGLDGGCCDGGEDSASVSPKNNATKEAGSHTAPNQSLSGLSQRINLHLYRFKNEGNLFPPEAFYNETEFCNST